MRKWLIALMVVISVALAAVVVCIHGSSDRLGPEIIFSGSKDLVYRADMTEEELLEGVTAIDDKDGDVSNTLTIESVYEKNDKEYVVVFVAKDSSNNVTKQDLTMQYSAAAREEAEEEEEKESELDKDEEPDEMTDEEKSTSQETGGSTLSTENDSALADSSLTDSSLTKEEEAKKTQEAKINSLSAQDPRFYLTTYYVEIPVGTAFDSLSYVSDIQDDVDSTYDLYRKIQIEGSVDVNTPGTYEVTYYVVDTTGNVSNGAVLTVVVQ
jgi:lipopolysaccharide export LptBFGC system permease protein LptF